MSCRTCHPGNETFCLDYFEGFICTEPKGHLGDHRACGVGQCDHPMKTWPNEASEKDEHPLYLNPLLDPISVSYKPIKDSGKRVVFSSGMVRDVSIDKVKYHLAADGPMLKRWAKHLTLGAKKYDERNWMKAATLEEYWRFKESAFRHFMQWYYDELDEDHAGATFFNINGAEYTKDQMEKACSKSVPQTAPTPDIGSDGSQIRDSAS